MFTNLRNGDEAELAVNTDCAIAFSCMHCSVTKRRVVRRGSSLSRAPLCVPSPQRLQRSTPQPRGRERQRFPRYAGEHVRPGYLTTLAADFAPCNRWRPASRLSRGRVTSISFKKIKGFNPNLVTLDAFFRGLDSDSSRIRQNKRGRMRIRTLDALSVLAALSVLVGHCYGLYPEALRFGVRATALSDWATPWAWLRYTPLCA